MAKIDDIEKSANKIAEKEVRDEEQSRVQLNITLKKKLQIKKKQVEVQKKQIS